MAIPTSTLFDEIDWNQRYATTVDTGDRAITDGTVGVLAEADTVVSAAYAGKAVRLRADATNKPVNTPELATIAINTTVPSTFTFEFDVSLPQQLPDNFSDQDDRVFVGASNAQGFVAGFLFSDMGIAIAASPFSEFSAIKILQGSLQYMYDSSGNRITDISIRCVCDATAGTLAVYIEPQEDAYANNILYGAFSLSYTVAAIESTLSTDQVLLAVRSKPSVAANYQLDISSLRLSSSVVVSPDKPDASIPYADTVLVGRRFVLDGRGSVAPTGEELTYLWEIEEAPEGSESKLAGYTASSATIGSVANDNKILIEHQIPSSSKNGFSVNVTTAQSGESPLILEVIDDEHIRITLETDSAGAIQTSAAQLVSAINNGSAAGYDADVAEVIAATLDSAVTGAGDVDVEVAILAGGAGSTRSKTSLQIDKPGIYRFSLIVSDGIQTSDPKLLSVIASLDRQLLGHRPNMEYVWRSLSDFWNLVKDKAQISAVWSAAAQAISDDLMKLLQHDYAKSLRDISRRFQRRWLNYPLEVPIPESLQDSLSLTTGGNYFVRPDISYITGGGVDASFATVTNRGTLVEPDTGADLPLIGEPVNITATVVVNSNGVIGKTTLGSITASTPYNVVLATPALQSVDVIDSGIYGNVVSDPTASPAPTTSNYFSSELMPLKTADIQSGDWLVMDIDGTIVTREIDTPTPLVGGVIAGNTVKFLGSALDVTGVKSRWQIVRRVAYNQMFQMPHFDFSGFINVALGRFVHGDVARVTYTHPINGSTATAQLPILHTTSTKVFVDWRPLFNELNLLSKALHASGDPLMADHDIAPVYTMTGDSTIFSSARITHMLRTEIIPVSSDLVSVPQMGESTIGPDLKENRDYEVDAGEITLEPLHNTTGTTIAGGSRIYLKDYVNTTLPLSAISVTAGEIGTYTVLSTGPSGEYVDVAHTFSSGETHTVHFPRYSFNSDIPEKLWAEANYFDNSQTIENNFGLVAGLPKSVLEEEDINLDYLTIVKAIWFAFMQGPTINNIKVASEAFMGFPFSEVEGQVTVINPEETDTTGRIVVKEVDSPDYRTYLYPTDYDVALNPNTERQIKAVTLAQAKADYRTAEEQVRLAEIIANTDSSADAVAKATLELQLAQNVDDSKIPAYTGLVNAVSVFDYVSEPTKISKLMTGTDELKKFHTFVIQIPSKGLDNLNFLATLKDYVLEWKPKHTHVLFFGLASITDDIDIEEDLYISPTLLMSDTVYTSPVTKGADNTLTWPTDNTDDNNPDTILWTYDDVEEKYESSYAAGVFDDFSGDGSWNALHGILDPVNTVDSDVDVCASKMWVPVEKDPLTDEFQIGEEVELFSGANTLIGLGWDSSAVQFGGAAGWAGAAPIIEYISTGPHPEIGFNVYSPQNEHPFMYLLLGFNTASGDGNLGTTNRLRALQRLEGIPNIGIRGKTSSAEADVQYLAGTLRQHLDRALDPTHLQYELHRRYFIIERMFSFDKILEFGPVVEVALQPTMYIPLGGTVLPAQVNLEDESPFAVGDGQLQMRPFNTYGGAPYVDPTMGPADQVCPSFGAGGFFVPYFATTPGVTLYKWGYVDQGELTPATPFGNWDYPAATAAIENIHIGRRVVSHKNVHLTHGFTQFYVPAPKIMEATIINNNRVRIEGHYFVADDPLRVAIPTSTPSSYTGGAGIDGGGWVFFRDTTSLVETPVTGYNLSTGVSGDLQFDNQTANFSVGDTVTGASSGATAKVWYQDDNGADGVLAVYDVDESGGPFQNNETITSAGGSAKVDGPFIPRNVLGIAPWDYVGAALIQTGTGHVIDCEIPAGLASGTYDLIVRNYRVFRYSAAGALQYHMDEHSIQINLTAPTPPLAAAPQGFGKMPAGSGSFGV